MHRACGRDRSAPVATATHAGQTPHQELRERVALKNVAGLAELGLVEAREVVRAAAGRADGGLGARAARAIRLQRLRGIALRRRQLNATCGAEPVAREGVRVHEAVGGAVERDGGADGKVGGRGARASAGARRDSGAVALQESALRAAWRASQRPHAGLEAAAPPPQAASV